MLTDDMTSRRIGLVPVDVFLEELMYYSEFLADDDDDEPQSSINFPHSTKTLRQLTSLCWTYGRMSLAQRGWDMAVTEWMH